MKKTLINVLLFTTGAAIGSLVTWKVLKTKYERIIQEEIDSVKETWARMNQENHDEDDLDEDDLFEDNWDEETVSNYHDLAGKYNRSSTGDVENDKEGGGDDEGSYVNGPYVINPNDYGDGNYDHNLCNVTYYADGILADTWDVELDIDETIGEDAINHFGDYGDDDVIHVRNERLQIDYEVVRDPRNYKDVIKSSPAPAYAD